MLGWNIAVYRLKSKNIIPSSSTELGKRLAVWQTGLGGLDWLDGLVKENKALDLGGNGYPNRYVAQALNIISSIKDKPPLAKDVWSSDEGDILLDDWAGKTVLDNKEMLDCMPEEWLLIEAFDES